MLTRYLASLTASLTAIFLLLIAWPAAALAQAGGADPDLLELFRPVWEAISSGNYGLAAAGAVVLIGAVLTRWGASIWGWFSTGAGRAAIVLLTAFGGALFAALQAGAPVSVGVIWASLKLAVTAAGLYSLAKALVLEPLQRWVARGAPTAIRWLTSALGWLLNRIAPPPAVEAKSNDLDSFARGIAEHLEAAKRDPS